MRDYKPFYGSDEESSEVEDPFAKEALEHNMKNPNDNTSQLNDEDLMDQEEIQNQWKKMKAKMNSSKALRGFLQGCQFCAKFKGLKLNIYAPSRLILKGN